jgi:hypothetical protein
VCRCTDDCPRQGRNSVLTEATARLSRRASDRMQEPAACHRTGAQRQVGRALDHLGVEHIAAYSPQARGRSERMFHTLQDRLTKELALAKIGTVEAANAFIRDVYIPAHNARFACVRQARSSLCAFNQDHWVKLSLPQLQDAQNQASQAGCFGGGFFSFFQPSPGRHCSAALARVNRLQAMLWSSGSGGMSNGFNYDVQRRQSEIRQALARSGCGSPGSCAPNMSRSNAIAACSSDAGWWR